MPHLSKNKLPLKTEKELISTFDVVVKRLSEKEDVENFLSSLLSPTERLMLAKRLSAATMIKMGIPENQIAVSLHITRETVSRLVLFLESRGKGYEIALKKLKEEKALNEFKEFLLKIAKYTIRAAGGYVKP